VPLLWRDRSVECRDRVQASVRDRKFVPSVIIIATDQANAIRVIPIVRHSRFQLNVGIGKGIVHPIGRWNFVFRLHEPDAEGSVFHCRSNVSFAAAGHETGPGVQVGVELFGICIGYRGSGRRYFGNRRFRGGQNPSHRSHDCRRHRLRFKRPLLASLAIAFSREVERPFWERKITPYPLAGSIDPRL
jgi:hypothetical protein